MINLSILICTLPERKESYKFINDKLMRQCCDLGVFSGQVEICTINNTVMTTGAKRNALLEMSRGKFIVFVDDDDDVSDDYVEKIFFTILKHPYIDCIGIEGIITTDGMQQKDWIISVDCKDWYEENDVYFRTPNHISPVRRELALQAGFPDVTYAEDREYSKRLLPLCKNEAKIKGSIYHYKYISKK